MSEAALVQEASQSGDPRVYRDCEDAYSASLLELYEQETVSDLERGGHRGPSGLFGSKSTLRSAWRPSHSFSGRASSGITVSHAER